MDFQLSPSERATTRCGLEGLSKTALQLYPLKSKQIDDFKRNALKNPLFTSEVGIEVL